MPSLRQSRPRDRIHKASGQAFVELSGRRHYVGRHVTKASKCEYDRQPCAEFGPTALKLVRQKVVDEALDRKVINQRIGDNPRSVWRLKETSSQAVVEAWNMSLNYVVALPRRWGFPANPSRAPAG